MRRSKNQDSFHDLLNDMQNDPNVSNEGVALWLKRQEVNAILGILDTLEYISMLLGGAPDAPVEE